jgi:hypothetical protein
LGTLSNGALLLVPGVDGRSRIARRARRIAQSLFKELGGSKKVPEWKSQLIQRVTFASIACEVIETKMLHGEEVDHELHAKATRTLALMLQRLGLDPTKSTHVFDEHGDSTEPTTIRRVIVEPKAVQR